MLLHQSPDTLKREQRTCGGERWESTMLPRLHSGECAYIQSDLSDEVGDADIMRLAGDVGEELDVEGDGDKAGADIGVS